MSKNNVAEALRALMESSDKRSETARLNDVFHDIEAALKAGVSRQSIVETLQAQGFSMGLKSFESALYRLRKKHYSKTSETKEQRPETSKLKEKIKPFNKVESPTPEKPAVKDFQINSDLSLSADAYESFKKRD